MTSARQIGLRGLRAFIPLPADLSARDWRIRHANDEVPDAVPYGFDKMERYGVVPEFSERPLSPPIDFLARVGRRSSGGLCIVEALSDTRHKGRTQSDVVLCYHERLGIPASLLSSAKSPPVVTGNFWLTERSETPYVICRAANRALPRMAHIFAQSSPLLDNLQSDWGVPSDRMSLIPLGIDTDFYQVQPQPETSGLVVSAGVDVMRDHSLLIEAVSKVKEENREVRLEIAAGFKVKADMPPELGRVHTEQLHGRMRDLYRRASVVAVAVRPTIRASGSTVVLEGMASGRPVVVTGNPGLAEYVQDGVTGILVRPGDVDAMAKAIADLLRDPDRAAEMGKAAAEDVRRRFTSDIMAKQLAALVLSAS